MILRIRENKFFKVTVFLVTVQLTVSTLGGNYAFAGDGGPTQPEVQSFEPMGTNQMVDPFTGDFTYNIPLFNLPGPNGGYPVNLAYHSGAQMDQEASWVGLGWNINMGTISRQVRNLPDDFNEDVIKIKTDQKPNWTVSIEQAKSIEFIGIPSDNLNIGLTHGITYYYNNYKGFGYSSDFGLSLKIRKITCQDNTTTEYSTLAGDLGFNVKLDSREGISGSVSAGYSVMDGISQRSSAKKNLSISTGFSRNGWQKNFVVQKSMMGSVRNSYFIGNQYSILSFAQPIVNLNAPQAMRGGQGKFSYSVGANVPGIFTSKKSSGSFEISKLKNKNKTTEYKGYGYLNYQNNPWPLSLPQDDYRVNDFNLENEGLVHKNTRRLVIPTQTYDNYMVTGQGIGNSFRPHRADIGYLRDSKVHSEYNGGNIGIEVGPGIASVRVGLDVGYSYASTNIEPWPDNLISMSEYTTMNEGMSNSVYFQAYGEKSHDDLVGNYGTVIANDKPVAYALNAEDSFYQILNLDQEGNTVVPNSTRTQRKKRAQDIEAFTNDMIMDGDHSVIPEFAVDYYQATHINDYKPSNASSYDGVRKNLPEAHVGGYLATTPDGLRYVYGIAAQSTLEKDVVFSAKEDNTMINSAQITSVPGDYKIPGTAKYYNSVEKGTYTHSHLLTSILGEDYVDLDNIKGPSDGDLGYWVKFNYLKAYDNFQWKSPYEGVNYNRGYKTNFRDGTVSYSYGKKEIWYVATVETKTHVAEFILSGRDDCKAIAGETASVSGSDSYKKLDQINVYLKSERYNSDGSINSSAKPIQSCHFQYNYSLCPGTPDNGSGGGKLTLEKVWFTYNGNQIGSTNPYEFEYNTTIGGTTITYSKFAVNRWGDYKPFESVDNPYVDPYESKTVMDERAGLWNMKAINLPSGGRYEVTYESDSYAYVQNEVAMQMYPIASLDPYDQGSSGISAINCAKNAPGTDRRVYFKLEVPIPNFYTTDQQKAAMRKYIREGEYLYFKVNINLTKAPNSKELVGGYAKVNDVNVDATSDDGSNFLWGYVELDPLKVNDKSTEFHPFTEVGARHIRYNQPEILVDNMPGADIDNLNKSVAKSIATSMLSTVYNMKQLYKNYTASLYQNGNDRLSEIQLDASYLRMRTPDKVKFGGGHRVHEVKIYDNWADAFASNPESTSSYSTVYDYDLTDADGNKYSAGVAAYEPLIGGDENPLRNPVKGWEDKNIAAKTVANTYSEDPGNEANFPAPQVGYSQVRIMSGNTAQKVTNFADPTVHYGGITVQQFYTAKDFPVISKVTELESGKTFRKSRLIIPALVVNIDRLRMAASQGYYTELNDMHGKPKGAQEYKLVGQDEEQLLSSVEYDYFDEEQLTTNRAGETFITRVLKNDVDVVISDYNESDMTKITKIEDTPLGVDIDFNQYTKYIDNKNISGSIFLNFEQNGFIPAFFPIPNFNWSEDRTGVVVTNKLVSKTGIIQKVTAIQQGSKVETENILFDDLTGTPLLTSVTNDFEDKIYNYSILARDVYDRAGAAYQNVGKKAYTDQMVSYGNGIQEVTMEAGTDMSVFVKGDKLVLIPVTSTHLYDAARPKYVAYYSDQDMNTGNVKLEVSNSLSGLYEMIVIQSGRKNNLTVPVSTISALSNPTEGRNVITCLNYAVSDLGDAGNFKVRKIDKVIGISAVELGEYWYKDTREINGFPSNWYNNAFYSKGFGGNFNPVRNYAYISTRDQSSNVNLKTDGVMNDVPLFNFESILAQPNSSGCMSNWRLVDQITLMNPSGNAIESKNILNTYTTSLYGRNGLDPIAVAQNAKNAEIGFESFEEYTTTSVDIDANATNNLNFYTTNSDASAKYVENRFDISGAGVDGLTDAPTSLLTEYSGFTVRIHFDAYSTMVGGSQVYYPKEERLVRLSASDITNIGTSGGQTSFKFNTANNLFNIPEQFHRSWRGEIFLKKAIPNPGANAAVLNLQKGHTGNNCLQVGASGGISFLQRRLNLIEGKEYQFSGWFSTVNNQSLMKDNSAYFQGNFKIEFLNASGTLMSSNTLTFNETDILQGTFIDEWQKFTLNFVMPTGARYVRIVLPRVNAVYDPQTSSSVYDALYDDLRIQPRDGGMQTYVYNTANQRLEAVLDENNYATFYYYDDEGQLFLVKQETEKGIITVQESRSSLKKN